MTPRPSGPRQDPAASRAIDVIIGAPGDWRSTMLARLRAVILSAGASIVEEVKWKKPSRPMGVPVWSRDGNICIGEALKSAVRLTFPKGALLKDPEHVFSTRLDSATVRAVDFRAGDMVNEARTKHQPRQARHCDAPVSARGRAPRPSARVRMPRCRLSRPGPARRSRAVPARHRSRQPRCRTSRRQ
jgi:hypothetical protein